MAIATSISLFFLSHGYDVSPFSPTKDQEILTEEPTQSLIQKGEVII